MQVELEDSLIYLVFEFELGRASVGRVSLLFVTHMIL